MKIGLVNIDSSVSFKNNTKAATIAEVATRSNKRSSNRRARGDFGFDGLRLDAAFFFICTE
jgi:hypothetical protein